MKRTPGRGVKEILKPLAYKEWELVMSDRVPIDEWASELSGVARLNQV